MAVESKESRVSTFANVSRNKFINTSFMMRTIIVGLLTISGACATTTPARPAKPAVTEAPAKKIPKSSSDPKPSEVKIELPKPKKPEVEEEKESPPNPDYDSPNDCYRTPQRGSDGEVLRGSNGRVMYVCEIA